MVSKMVWFAPDSRHSATLFYVVVERLNEEPLVAFQNVMLHFLCRASTAEQFSLHPPGRAMFEIGKPRSGSSSFTANEISSSHQTNQPVQRTTSAQGYGLKFDLSEDWETFWNAEEGSSCFASDIPAPCAITSWWGMNYNLIIRWNRFSYEYHKLIQEVRLILKRGFQRKLGRISFHSAVEVCWIKFLNE